MKKWLSKLLKKFQRNKEEANSGYEIKYLIYVEETPKIGERLYGFKVGIKSEPSGSGIHTGIILSVEETALENEYIIYSEGDGYALVIVN